MNAKERTLVALSREEPDRAPMFVTVVPEVAQRLGEVTGIPCRIYDAYLSNRISNAEILTCLGNDIVGIGSTAPPACPPVGRSDGCKVDEWGLVYRPVAHACGVYYEIIERPLAGISSAKEVARYRVPDPAAPGRFDIAADHARRYGRDHALMGVIECTVFEMAWNLVGLEQFLADMATQAGYVEPLLDAITEYSIGIGLELIALGADIMLTGDDVGTDRGPMLSLGMWRRLLKPRLKRVFDAYRAANPAIKLAYHSCGAVQPFIDELLEIGLDVLNPIQVTAQGMEPELLKARYGDRLAFCGAIDQRHVLPQGTPEDVATEVRRRVQQMGRGGGFVIAPTHDIQSDTPVENVLALFDAVKKYGSYPLAS